MNSKDQQQIKPIIWELWRNEIPQINHFLKMAYWFTFAPGLSDDLNLAGKIIIMPIACTLWWAGMTVLLLLLFCVLLISILLNVTGLLRFFEWLFGKRGRA